MLYRNLNPRALGFSGTLQSEMIELALTYGFRGLDLDIVDYGQQVDDFGMEQARRLIDSAKFVIGNIALPVRLGDDDATFDRDLARLPRLAQLTQDMGCARAYTSVRPASDKLPFDADFELHVKRITAVADVLASHDIRLGLEFLGAASLREGKAHPFIHDLAGLLKLVAAVGKPNVGIVVDSWHLFASGGTLDELKAVPAESIVTVHIADAPRDIPAAELQDLDRRLPGETGLPDQIVLLKWLESIGYEGPVTPEPLKGRLKGMGRQRAVKMVGDATLAVWRAAELPLGLRTINAAGEAEFI